MACVSRRRDNVSRESRRPAEQQLCSHAAVPPAVAATAGIPRCRPGDSNSGNAAIAHPPRTTGGVDCVVQPGRGLRRTTSNSRGQLVTRHVASVAAAPFVIFSMPRCGSTTLMRALNCYPSVLCALEPFAPSDAVNTPHNEIATVAELRGVLQEIWQTHNGIKHVWAWSGWPFPNPCLNRWLLLNEGLTVVFLSRRNELRRLVSTEISLQTGVWSTFTDSERRRVRSFAFQPLSIEKLKRELDAFVLCSQSFRQAMRDLAVRVSYLHYEDLFGEDVSLIQKIDQLELVLDFVGLTTSTDPQAHSRLAHTLDPGNNQLNDVSTYSRIPNAHDIERQLGSEDTGWLFA